MMKKNIRYIRRINGIRETAKIKGERNDKRSPFIVKYLLKVKYFENSA